MRWHTDFHSVTSAVRTDELFCRGCQEKPGAAFSEVSKKHNIEEIFGVIQDELRSQYSLGYVSDEPVRVSEFRKLQLTTKQKGLVVQARDRYWAQR